VLSVSLPDRSALIRRDDPRLLSVQVADDLREQIKSGEVIGRLPNETELAAQYGIGRVTVRKAIALLTEEGVLVVVHGRGTFVA
jgi:DNA-binding GntR family transcriptional regulator